MSVAKVIEITGNGRRQTLPNLCRLTEQRDRLLVLILESVGFSQTSGSRGEANGCVSSVFRFLQLAK